MARFFRNREAGKGFAPGSLIFIGNKKIEKIRTRVIDFTTDELKETEPQDLPGIGKYKEPASVSWINIDGLHDTQKIEEIGKIFDLHPLLLEDMVNTTQRPKVEEYDNCLFIVMKMLRYDEEKEMILSEQISIVLGKNYLLTFQERVGDVFEPVRERIRKQKGRIRKNGCDYLAYAILDTLVDNYMYLITHIGDRIEELEDNILKASSEETLEKISKYKREISYIRKTIRPTRELITSLPKLESEFLKNSIVPFLKDLLDLITQVSEAVETYREILADQLNIYNSNVSNKMNDVMKVLTIFAAIFIPLTFLAGIYGTNFEYLPELHFRYSYYIFLGIMLLIAGGMVRFFRKKGWL
jgi:magnesium transporter